MRTWTTFTSPRLGYSIRYPSGWTVTAATAPWAYGTNGDQIGAPSVDQLAGPGQIGFVVSSQKLPAGVSDSEPPFEYVEILLSTARRFRDAHGAVETADEGRRAEAEAWCLWWATHMDLRFAPGGGLVPELMPASLFELAAVAVLEELRGVGPILQCLNYPSPGCLRDVPLRRGDRGRQPLYCSRQCSTRAASRRRYERVRLTRSSNGGAA